MPPKLALSICILFVLFLFWMDRKREYSSKALWIPLIWMFLAGSRYVSQWLNLAPGRMEAYQEGSPIDAVVFAFLIGSSFYILSKRKIDWNRWIIQNKWIWLYFLYCAISITWSDYPFVSLKRWIKELGNIFMVLVILTDKRPYEAFGVIIRRLAFLWLPLSIVFNKYFPALGRAYHWDGTMMLTGVSYQKNSLGLICLICGIFFSWKLLVNGKNKFDLNKRDNLIDLFFLGIAIWLLYLSDSATSLVCFASAVTVFFVSRTKIMTEKPKRIISLGLTIGIFYFIMEEMLGIKEFVLELLGRDSSLTTRVPMWEFLYEISGNFLVGVGYHSFWMGERLLRIWDHIRVPLNQAHNGYLEQYLNLGIIGVTFILILFVSGLLKVNKHLNVDYRAGLLRLSLIVVAILYNYAEAAFYGISNMWLLTLFAIVEIPTRNIYDSPATYKYRTTIHS